MFGQDALFLTHFTFVRTMILPKFLSGKEYVGRINITLVCEGDDLYQIAIIHIYILV